MIALTFKSAGTIYAKPTDKFQILLADNKTMSLPTPAALLNPGDRVPMLGRLVAVQALDEVRE